MTAILSSHETCQLTCSCPSISHSYPSVRLVQWMAAFGRAHALGGSTREQSDVPHTCKKDLCSATRQHWCSCSLPKRQMLPYLSISTSHSLTQFWPFAQAGDCSHLTHEWVQLTNYRMHPGFCWLMQLNWLLTGSSTSVTEAAAVHDLKWVHPAGSIEILDCLNISQDLATSPWQSKDSWGVAVCLLPLIPQPNTSGLLSGLQ